MDDIKTVNGMHYEIWGNSTAWAVSQLQTLELTRILDGRRYNHGTQRFALSKKIDKTALVECIKNYGDIFCLGPTEWVIVGTDYTICLSVNHRGLFESINLVCKSKNPSNTLIDKLLKHLPGEWITNVAVGGIEWYFMTPQGPRTRHVLEIFDDIVLPEAYPYIPNLNQYIEEYMRSDEQVLVLLGSPGTGKTRFIRYLIQKLLSNQSQSHKVNRFEEDLLRSQTSIFYANDEKVLNNDMIYMDFITEDCQIMVLEDIDNNLGSRKSGNSCMTKLLSASDGLISNRGKKLVLSTNLNLTDIDEALLRPGRCFDQFQARSLTVPESMNFLDAYAKRFPEQASTATSIKTLMTEDRSRKEYPLSDIYKMINTGEFCEERDINKPGFCTNKTINLDEDNEIVIGQSTEGIT